MRRQISRGAPSQIPAVLLAKLALRRDLQGSGLGAELLVRALDQVVQAAKKAGGRLIVVDAIDDAARSFYEYQGFQPIPTNPSRLIMKMSTSAKIVGRSWP